MFTESFQCVVGRQTRLQKDLWFSSAFAFSPAHGQKYADESLLCNKVISRGAAAAEVCRIAPAGW